MTIENNKFFLELKIIRKDDDIFELQVTASNGRFRGMTEIYETSESLEKFANSLLGFPKQNLTLFHEIGIKDGYSYFSMKYYCIENSEYLGIEIALEENVVTSHRNEEKDKLKLEIFIERAAIDNFQKELIELAKKQEGKAIIFGRNDSIFDGAAR